MFGNTFRATAITVMCAIGFACALTAQEAAKPRHAPDALPGVEPEMLTAAYWIALQSDAVRSTSRHGYRRFNAKTARK